MRVLLDENLEHGLRQLLPQFEVSTVQHRGWSGLKNGELLQAIGGSDVEVLITGDQGLRYEQNLAGRGVAVITLSTLQLPRIREHITRLAKAIESAKPGSFRMVDCGSFSRKRPDRRS